jgi:pimeloyl-ACP methyl ester carboxylesterase
VEFGVVLVHGLWHGAWTWDAVRQRLDGQGISSVAVELPLTSLDDDVAATAASLAAFDRPAVLVGHSYGGAVVTAAGVYPSVRQLVYLAGFQLDVGESVSRVLPDRELPETRLPEALRIDGNLVELDPVLGAELLYHDADADTAAAAMARVRPVQRSVFRGIPPAIAWHSVPSTYAVSTDDRVVHPQLQRAMAERASRVVEWAGGHSAPLVRADDVTALIVETIRLSGTQSG